MSCLLLTPIIEDKPFLLRDSALPKMKFEDDDTFSTDSWETASVDDPEELKLPTLVKARPFQSITIKTESLITDLKNDTDSDSHLTSMLSSSSKMKKNLLDETPEMRELKRERNRLAARKCRQKQKDRIEILEQDVREITQMNCEVESEIRSLKNQLDELKNLLVNHECVMRIPSLTRQKYLINF